MPDPRCPQNSTYPQETLVWSALLIFLLGLKSRRQFRFESDTQAFVANLNRLAGSRVNGAPHDDTLAYYLERVPWEPFEQLPMTILRRLIRMKVLDRWRLYGRFLIAVDGTGQLFFRHRHCPHCLTQRTPSGEVLYFHQVLEAKLVTANGLAFSMATEFIENTDRKATKQDCELKAFYRLADKLKASFPQLPIVLLADSLYACKPVFDLCRKYRWMFLMTFKQGSMPALFKEFETLRDLSPKNRAEKYQGKAHQYFAWLNDLSYEGHRLSALECREFQVNEGPGTSHYFAWITNFEVGCASASTLSNQGGLQRWKIENEGFNIQKNHGYQLEHTYSDDANAAKIFYFLLQIAHAINQLMMKGSLLRDFNRVLGSIRNYLRRLAEAMRNHVMPFHPWDPGALPAFQIRLDSS